MIGHEVALVDRRAQLVGKCGLFHFEETKRVAYKGFVFAVRRFVNFTGNAGRGGETQLNAVKVLDYAAPLAVNRAMTFVADDQIEIARAVVAINIDHALQRSDGDALFVLKAATGTQHVRRIVRQRFGERILRLFRERDAVNQEKHACNRIGFKQALDEGSRSAGFARACCHFDQHFAPTLYKLAAQRFDAGDLIGAAGNLLIYACTEQITANAARGCTALKVVLSKKGFYRTWKRFGLPFPEQDFFAVGEKHVRNAELPCVISSLLGCFNRLDGKAFGFEHRKRASVAVTEHVVRFGFVWEHVLITNVVGVFNLPALSAQQRIDPHAGKGFVICGM